VEAGTSQDEESSGGRVSAWQQAPQCICCRSRWQQVLMEGLACKAPAAASACQFNTTPVSCRSHTIAPAHCCAGVGASDKQPPSTSTPPLTSETSSVPAANGSSDPLMLYVTAQLGSLRQQRARQLKPSASGLSGAQRRACC
jgi:hypothetical protein